MYSLPSFVTSTSTAKANLLNGTCVRYRSSCVRPELSKRFAAIALSGLTAVRIWRLTSSTRRCRGRGGRDSLTRGVMGLMRKAVSEDCPIACGVKKGADHAARYAQIKVPINGRSLGDRRASQEAVSALRRSQETGRAQTDHFYCRMINSTSLVAGIKIKHRARAEPNTSRRTTP